MTIQNVARTTFSVLKISGGVVTTLTADPGESPPHAFLPYITHHGACKRNTAWFEGRLWTTRLYTWGPGASYSACTFRRWDNDPVTNTWEHQPGYTTSKHLNVVVLSAMPYAFGTPGLFAYKDNIFMFWDGTSAHPTASGTNSHTWGYMRWNPSPATDGTSTIEAWEYTSQPGYYKKAYNKSAGIVDHGHILDIIEHGGTIYVATPVTVFSMTPPSGDLILIDESINWNNMVAKAFGIFKVGSGVASLYMLDANGKVKQITGVVSEVADLKLINANITNGNSTTLGYGPAIVQIGTSCYAFLNDTTGTVLFSSTDGVNWTEISGSLPGGWRSVNSHIKCTIDPSVPEVRVMIMNASTGAFDIYSFDGSTFTYLGSGSSANSSFTFFDKDAADAELEGSVTVNAGLGTVSIPFQLFREVSATGTINVQAEYSLDGGATWSTATGTPKVNLNASDSRPAGAGVAYTFTWNYTVDLGPGLYPNVRFRIRSI